MKAIKKILFTFLALILFSLLVELLLSIVFYFKDQNITVMHVRDYPYLYYLFEPGGDLNEHGFKTNYPIKKEQSQYRIILVGGSVARGTAPQRSIATFLEKKLNKRLNTDNIEVLNAGISAFVVEQEFILVQLILQQYEPDMIIGLDGYNDLLTFKLNRMYDPDFDFPPHNWSDFRVIKEHQFRRKPYGRFPYFYKNTNRVKEYYLRKQFEKNYDWDRLTEEQISMLSKTYWGIVQDSHDFCKAKGIAYINFIQPVRFHSQYINNEELSTSEQALAKLYDQMIRQGKQFSYAYSLDQLFVKNLAVFKDDCHVSFDGNEAIAVLMANQLFELVKQSMNLTTDSTYTYQ